MTYKLTIMSLNLQKSMIVSVLLLASGIQSLMVLCEMLLKALKGDFKTSLLRITTL